MSNAPKEDHEFRDDDFEAALYRVMRSCGWLLPRTPEDLRQAEAELAADPVELPASLCDAFRIFDAAEADPIEKNRTPSALGRAESREVRIPSGLQRLAHEVGLTFDQVTSLIGMQAQIIANRSTSRNEELSYEDWKRFFEAVKEFL